MIRRPPSSTLFPYTPLSQSPAAGTGSAASTSSATPSPTLRAQIDPVDAALAQLDRRDQVAQLIVVGVALTDLSPDRKSTRLNSSHANISYAVFCLKKKYRSS